MNKLYYCSAVLLGIGTMGNLALADVGAEMEAEADGPDVGAQMSAEESSSEEQAAADDDADDDADESAGATIAGDEFAAPSGPTGAGLSLSPAQKARAWGELAFHTQSGLTIVSPLLGGGYKVTDTIEIELILPLSFASYDTLDFATGEMTTGSDLVFGDPYIGANYLGGSGLLKYKVGAGIALPLAPADSLGHILALGGAAGARGLQEYHLWLPETFSILAPARVEYGDDLVFGGDAALGVHVPTGDFGGDTELSLSIAPGVGMYFGQTLVGGRLPIFWMVTGEGDAAQIALEPYFRHHLSDSAFLQGRFTLNLDEPAGFSFDEDKFWGLHLGGGATF